MSSGKKRMKLLVFTLQNNKKHQYFKIPYFLSTIIEWNKLDSNIQKMETLNIFKSKILKFVRPIANSISGCHNRKGVKLLTRL